MPGRADAWNCTRRGRQKHHVDVGEQLTGDRLPIAFDLTDAAIRAGKRHESLSDAVTETGDRIYRAPECGGDLDISSEIRRGANAQLLPGLRDLERIARFAHCARDDCR